MRVAMCILTVAIAILTSPVEAQKVSKQCMGGCPYGSCYGSCGPQRGASQRCKLYCMANGCEISVCFRPTATPGTIACPSNACF
jgi:hypothetical protein